MGKKNDVEKKEPTTRELINDTIKRTNDIMDKALTLFRKCNTIHEKLNGEMKELRRIAKEFMVVTKKKLDYQEESLVATRKVAAAAEQTLLNVLLAIRQNEYLQAYYPEQHGYPAMKVVGPHPIKLEENNTA